MAAASLTAATVAGGIGATVGRVSAGGGEAGLRTVNRARGSAAGAARLVAEIAVLRRPQTAADRLPASLARMFADTVPSLTRLLATVDAGRAGMRSVYLLVFSTGPCGAPASRSNGGDEASLLTVVDRGTGHRGGWVESMGFSAADLQRFAVIPVGTGEYWQRTPQVLASIVPDGVVRAKWVFRWVPHKGAPKHPPFVTVYPTLRDNVAVSTIPPWLTQASASLYFTDGSALTSKDEVVNLPICREREVLLGAKNPIAPWLKQHFAVFRPSHLARPLPEPEGPDGAGYFAKRGFRLDFTRARVIDTGAGLFGAKPDVWVVPGASGVCLIYGPPAGLGTCGGQPILDSGGFWFSGRDHHDHNMYTGLVPDGNRTVSIVLAGGVTKTVPVLANVYSVTVTGRAVALIDKDATGQQERFPLYTNANQF
jgi:hypothetical protein